MLDPLHFRPLHFKSLGGARVLCASHPSNQIERISVEPSIFQHLILEVNANDLSYHQAPAWGLAAKIDDPLQFAFETNRRFRHLWRTHHLGRPGWPISRLSNSLIELS